MVSVVPVATPLQMCSDSGLALGLALNLQLLVFRFHNAQRSEDLLDRFVIRIVQVFVLQFSSLVSC